MKKWDNGMKRLLVESPQDILDWVLQGASFTGNRSQEFESIMLDADVMHEALYLDKPILLHLEFQSGPHPDMEQRLLEYSVLAHRYYEHPICSVVIYLKKGGRVATSPLIRTLPDGEEFLRFRFHVILLWDIPYEELMAKGLPGLLPLAPLAKDGAKREVVEQIIARLAPPGESARKELLALTRLFASLAFDNQEDQEWLKRRFEMLKDILRDTPAYQQILEEGREEGRGEGREELRRSIQSLGQNLLDVVQTRFPRLKTITKRQIVLIKRPETLGNLLTRAALVSTEEEMREALITWEEPEAPEEEI